MTGMMSNVDILEAMKKYEMMITPFDFNDPDESRLTPAGFNFTFTRFIVSLNSKMFCKVYEERSKDRYYQDLCFYLEPGDTALALTNESVWVSRKLAGTFHSKVTYVSQGLGHISTTLDPGWMGQLLISINNPNSKKVRVVIGKKNKKDGHIEYNSFITLCLYRLMTSADQISNNKNARLDILYDILMSNDNISQEFKQLMSNINELRNIIEDQYQKHPNILNKSLPPTHDDYQNFVDNHQEVLNRLDALQPEIEKILETSTTE